MVFVYIRFCYFVLSQTLITRYLFFIVGMIKPTPETRCNVSALKTFTLPASYCHPSKFGMLSCLQPPFGVSKEHALAGPALNLHAQSLLLVRVVRAPHPRLPRKCRLVISFLNHDAKIRLIFNIPKFLSKNVLYLNLLYISKHILTVQNRLKYLKINKLAKIM